MSHGLGGILNINKPRGQTSRSVVDHVRQLCGLPRVGHAGTLDPLATGVLLVAVGAATRLTEYLHRHAKCYQAVLRLGVRSATDDVEEALEPVTDAASPTADQLESVLEQFRGHIEQRPPDYSAVHIGGRRAYALARSGHRPVMPLRQVEIRSLRLLDYTYPRLEVEVVCSTGTYIRSLARDIGEGLGCGAVLAELVRTAIGPFRLADACDPAQLTPDNWRSYLRHSVEALAPMRRLQLPRETLRRLSHGQAVPGDAVPDAVKEGMADRRPLDHFQGAADEDEPVAVVDEKGELVAVVTYQHHTGQIQPHRVFARV